jgi:hypothetical protein
LAQPKPEMPDPIIATFTRVPPAMVYFLVINLRGQ